MNDIFIKMMNDLIGISIFTANKKFILNLGTTFMKIQESYQRIKVEGKNNIVILTHLRISQSI